MKKATLVVFATLMIVSGVGAYAFGGEFLEEIIDNSTVEEIEEVEEKSEPVLEAHGKKLKPETLLLEDEFKNILKAAIAYQVYLYASFPGIHPETVEEITLVMFEGKPEEIKIVEWLLTFQPWVDQNHFNYWKKFRKNLGGM